MLEVSGLYCYPIKSCGQVSLDRADITTLGLAHDRRWMLIDEEGCFLSQRQQPQMSLIQVELMDKNGCIRVSAPNQSSLIIRPDDTKLHMSVKIWNDRVKAEIATNDVNEWFSAVLNINCRLVRYSAISCRPVDSAYNTNKDQVAFADGFPLLLTHEATLDQLNHELEQVDHPPVLMKRFRPNIVVTSTLPAQSEWQWKTIGNDQIKLSLVKPCSRCQITNIDPDTGFSMSSSVLKTLAQHHRLNNKATFGINATVIETGKIALGDQLQMMK